MWFCLPLEVNSPFSVSKAAVFQSLSSLNKFMMLLKRKKNKIKPTLHSSTVPKEKQSQILVKGWKDNFYSDSNRAEEKGFSIELSFNSTKHKTRRLLKH